MRSFHDIEHIDFIDPKVQCNHCLKLYGCHYKNYTASKSHHFHFYCLSSPIKKKNIGNDKSSAELRIRVNAKRSCFRGLGKYNVKILRHCLPIISSSVNFL